MVLKSYLALNYNCSGKKKRMLEYQPTLFLKKDSLGRGPEFGLMIFTNWI